MRPILVYPMKTFSRGPVQRVCVCVCVGGGGGSDNQLILQRASNYLLRGSANDIPMETGTSTVTHVIFQ